MLLVLLFIASVCGFAMQVPSNRVKLDSGFAMQVLSKGVKLDSTFHVFPNDARDISKSEDKALMADIITALHPNLVMPASQGKHVDPSLLFHPIDVPNESIRDLIADLATDLRSKKKNNVTLPVVGEGIKMTNAEPAVTIKSSNYIRFSGDVVFEVQGHGIVNTMEVSFSKMVREHMWMKRVIKRLLANRKSSQRRPHLLSQYKKK